MCLWRKTQKHLSMMTVCRLLPRDLLVSQCEGFVIEVDQKQHRQNAGAGFSSKLSEVVLPHCIFPHAYHLRNEFASTQMCDHAQANTLCLLPTPTAERKQEAFGLHSDAIYKYTNFDSKHISTFLIVITLCTVNWWSTSRWLLWFWLRASAKHLRAFHLRTMTQME